MFVNRRVQVGKEVAGALKCNIEAAQSYNVVAIV